MIKRFIIHLLASAGSLYLISHLLGADFLIHGGIKGYLITALVLGFVNTLVKPLLKLLSIPFMLMTAGLFGLVLNMVVLWLVKYSLETLAFEGVSIQLADVATYFYVGFLIAISNGLIHWLVKKK